LPDWGPDISAASSNAYNSSTAWVDSQNYLTAVTGDTTPYSAGANIDITNHVVSGKDWNDDITAAANSAFTAATALIPTALTGDYVESTALNTGTYFDQIVLSGISGMPVFIRSADYARAADTANMSYISMTAHSLVGSASAWMDVTEYTAGPNISINHHIISGKNWTNDINYAFKVATAMIPKKYIPYNRITTGDSGTICYELGSGIRTTGLSGWVELYNQNNENEHEAHVQVGQNYDNGKSFWTEIDGGWGGFIQMNWNSGSITPNMHDTYDNDTTARLLLYNGGLSYQSANHSVTAGAVNVWMLEKDYLKFFDSNGNQNAAFGPTEYSDWYNTRDTVSANSASWGGANAFATGTIQTYEDGWAGFVYNDMGLSYHYRAIMPSASAIGGTWVSKQLDNKNYLMSFNITGLGPWAALQWDTINDVLISQHAFVRRVGYIELWREWDPGIGFRIKRTVNYPAGDNWTTFGHVQVYGAAMAGDNTPWHLDAILEVEKTN
jgi:hypothetical protein